MQVFKKSAPILAGFLLCISLQTHAQQALDGMFLGISELELQATFGTLQRLHKPTSGPRGVRGLWALPNTKIAGFPLETTFYIKDKRVQRIEQRWLSREPLCGNQSIFSVATSELQAKYGKGLNSSDSVQKETTLKSTIWEAGTFDVVSHSAQSHAQCSLIIIYKPHLENDASEL